MENDSNQTLLSICTALSQPLYLRLLEIWERCKMPDLKSMHRVCVRAVKSGVKRDFGGQETERYLIHYETETLRNSYIAVSYPWSLPDGEDTSERYRLGETPRIKAVLPPDIVLDRVHRFISHSKNTDTPFWIDKLCINQENGIDKEIAMQSMDLIYRESRQTLGLLFIRIQTVEQLKILKKLLQTRYIWELENGYTLRRGITSKVVSEVLGVIELIMEDSWWQRAWIFQEDYISSTRMKLLIRTSLPLAPNEHYSMRYFGQTPGEIVLRAVKFRKEVTKFCLALDHARLSETSGFTPGLQKDHREKAAKYSILYEEKELDAMSPTIFQHICTREIKYPSDILAIAANCCDYSQRLSSKVLNQPDQSLSLGILTLFLMNGEILKHDTTPMIEASREKNIYEFLKEQSLIITPPVPDKGLTFIKHCRFSVTELTKNGIATRGCLWKVFKEIDTRAIKCRRSSFDFQTSDQILSAQETEILCYLSDYLEEERHDLLVESLKCFSDEQEGVRQSHWSSGHLTVMMAKRIVRAIIQEETLWLACIYSSQKDAYSPYKAIFILEKGSSLPGFAFTSWNSAKDYANNDGMLKSFGATYVSLEVKYDQRLKKITPLNWINGLCFFAGEALAEYIIPWPPSLR